MSIDEVTKDMDPDSGRLAKFAIPCYAAGENFEWMHDVEPPLNKKREPGGLFVAF